MDETLVIYGALLLLAALALFALESFVPSYGFLSVAGAMALIAALWVLAESGVDDAVWAAAGAVGALALLFALVAAYKSLRAHRRPVEVGLEHLVGMVGQARDDLDPEGWVFVDGALWRATAEAPVETPSRVVVTGVTGEMTLRVRRVDSNRERRAIV